MADKVFITGATGSIGTHTVRRLVEAGKATTIFARNEEKARSLFEKEFATGNLSLVKGDYNDYDAFKKGIQGHTRLLILVANLDQMGEIKGKLGRLAYEAGVKQIVDISSFTVSEYIKGSYISNSHTVGEEALFKAAAESGRNVVVLRPGDFMTNALHGDAFTIKSFNKIIGFGRPERKSSLVDPRDIADVAVSVFLDPIEKHGNNVYDVHPEVLSNKERAEIFSRVLGRQITYQQGEIQAVYDNLIKHLPHKLAYDFASILSVDFDRPTPQIVILTKRPTRKYEDWIKENRSYFE